MNTENIEKEMMFGIGVITAKLDNLIKQQDETNGYLRTRLEHLDTRISALENIKYKSTGVLIAITPVLTAIGMLIPILFERLWGVQ